MARFSEKELKLIKTFYSLQETALKDGFKVKKARLYRDVFNAPNMSGASATTNANKILNRFKSLSSEEQNQYLKEWQLKATEEETTKKIEELKTLQLVNTALVENNKKFDVGLEEGKQIGRQLIKHLRSAVNFKTADGMINFLEHTATLLLEDYNALSKIGYYDEENKRYVSNAPVLANLIKGFTDIASINQARLHKSKEYLKDLATFQKEIEKES